MLLRKQSKQQATLKILIYISIIFFAHPAISIQQGVSNKVKAAYVFNFIKYVQWPDKHEKSFTVGFFGDDKTYFTALQQMQGMKVNNYTLNVTKIVSIEQLDQLQVVVLGKIKSKMIKAVAKKLNKQATVIVSDDAQDKKYTMLNFIETKENKLVFELNRYQMLNANLKVLPDILVLGGTELDIANVLNEMDETITDSLQEIQQQSSKLRQLEDNITSREELLKTQQEDLKTQQIKLTSQNKQLEKQNDELKKTKKDFQLLQNNYREVKQELGISNIQLTNNIDNLSLLKKDIVEKENAISSLGNQITERKSLLKSLEIQQSLQIKELAKQSSVIQRQYVVLIITALASLAILILLIVIYKSRQNQHKANQTLKANIETLAQVNLKLNTAQDQLVESEKMAALGGLVAGVAHEINTPLGVSVTASSHLSEHIGKFEKEFKTGQLKKSMIDNLLNNSKKSAVILQRNLERASELIRSFKQVAVDQSSEDRREFELKTYLEEVIQSLSPQFKKGGHHIKVTSNKEIKLNSYPGVLAQIMTNMIINSLRHGFKDKKEGEIHIELSVDGINVIIDFHDNGVGLTTPQRERVFEPFYTTARSEGGSGLGMSISYNLIISKLSGTFNCLESNTGAHFQISFPQ